MKLYEFTTTEHNGEQEYSHYHLVYAVNLDEAECKAESFCATWYDDENVHFIDDGQNGRWQFFYGEITLKLNNVQECKQTIWKESRFLDALIGGMPEENRLSDIKKDLAKYLADYVNHEIEIVRESGQNAPMELILGDNLEGVIVEALDAFESTQEKVVTITEGGE